VRYAGRKNSPNTENQYKGRPAKNQFRPGMRDRRYRNCPVCLAVGLSPHKFRLCKESKTNSGQISTWIYSEVMKTSASDLGSLVRNFVHPADIGRSRSSIVNPLQWAIPILIAAMVVSVFGHPPSWLLIYFAVLLGVDFAAFIGAFFYLLLTKPHLLRSESHDYKMSELIQSRQMAEFIQRREKQIKEGLFDEVADVSELKAQITAHSRLKAQIEGKEDR